MSNKKKNLHKKRQLKEILTYLSLTFGLGLIIGGILIANSELIYIPITCIYAGLILFCFGTFELALAGSEKRVIITKNLIVVRDNKQRDLCHIPKQSDFEQLYEIIKEKEREKQ